MHRDFETLHIPKNTFGTQLQFTLFDSNDNDESVSAYDKIVLRAFNPKNEEVFSGEVDETLATATSNIVHYTFSDGDLKDRGVYALFLELIKLSGSAITYKNSIEAGKIKVI